MRLVLVHRFGLAAVADGTAELRRMGRTDVGDAIVAGDAPFYRAVPVSRYLNPGIVRQGCGDTNLLDTRFLNRAGENAPAKRSSPFLRRIRNRPLKWLEKKLRV